MKSPNRLSVFFRSLSPTKVQLLKTIAAIGLLLLVAAFVDVGEAWSRLRNTDWRWLIPALLIVQVQLLLSAIRWKVTANRLGQPLSTARAVSEYYLATLANLSLPGGITGDAARVYRNRQSGALSTAIHSVILERFAGQIALLVVCIVGWLLWPVLMHGNLPKFGLLVICIALVMVVLVALCINALVRFAPDWISRIIVEFGPAVHAAWYADRQWMVQSVLSLAVVGTYILVFLFSSHAISAPLPWSALVTIVPLVLLSMVIPLSIGGWGIREAAAAVLWPVMGLSSEAGIATSIVYALISLLGCLPGLLLLLARSAK